MDRSSFVRRFQEHLPVPGRFRLKNTNPNTYVVKSNFCKITFIFERGSDTDFMLFLTSAESPNDGMNFYVMRHVFGARTDGPVRKPEEYAAVFRIYFKDFLDGDFSREKEYYDLEERILDGLSTVDDLAGDDPILEKLRNFDISWLSDISVR